MADHYTIRGGIDSTAMYKPEVTYATDPGTWGTGATHFGITQTVTPNVTRNLIKVRGLAGALPTANTEKTARDAHSILAAKSEVSVDVEYQPQNFAFLEYVFGTVSGSDPYYYPQQTAATESDKRLYLRLPSIAMMERFDFDGTVDAADTAFVFLGLKVNTWEMKAAIGEPVSCSVNLMGSDVIYDQTAVSTSYPYVALSTDDVYHFVESEVNVGGTPIANLIDGFTLTVNNSCEGLGDVRSYVNEAVVSKGRDFTLKIDANLENITFIKGMLGAGTGLTTPTKIATITLVLTKSGSKDLTVTLTNLKQADSFPGTNYGEVTKESITLEAELAYAVENVA